MADQQFVAAIIANGNSITGWESVTVKRSFHDGVSTFEFSTSENIFGPGTETPQLQPGDRVEITLGGKSVIQGFVTTRSVAIDRQNHEVVIAGKSMTADVNDSSVPIQPGSLKNSTMEQITRMVLAPHKVGLVIRNPPAIFSRPFSNFAVQYGETGGELIPRLAMMRGVFISDDEKGNLVLAAGDPKAGPVAELQEGRNILRMTGILDDQTAFSKYSFISQTQGSDGSAPPRDQGASIDNPSIRSNRQLISVSEHPQSSDELRTRAGMEAARSQWPTVQCSVTVVGWFKPDGSLWAPAENVSVIAPSVFPTPGGRAPPLGIQSVAFQQSNTEGTTTTLSLTLPGLLTSAPTQGLTDTGAQPAASPTPGETGGALSGTSGAPAQVLGPDTATG